MNIISIDNLIMDDLAQALKRGETVVYPTETCYGLGCDATDPTAVAKIFSIKQRVANKPVLILFPDIASAQAYVTWTPLLQKLAEQFWPGPLTLVSTLRSGATLAQGIISQENKIAFRISSHPFASQLVQGLSRPLVSTSANLSGQESPYSCAAVVAQFTTTSVQPDWVIDAGVLPQTPPSTIAEIDGEEIKILRQGEIILDV